MQNGGIVERSSVRRVHNGESALAAYFHDDIVGECGEQGLQVFFKIGGSAPLHHACEVSDGGGPDFGFRVGKHGDKAGHDEGLFLLIAAVTLNSEDARRFGKVFGKVVADSPVVNRKRKNSVKKE